MSIGSVELKGFLSNCINDPPPTLRQFVHSLFHHFHPSFNTVFSAKYPTFPPTRANRRWTRMRTHDRMNACFWFISVLCKTHRGKKIQTKTKLLCCKNLSLYETVYTRHFAKSSDHSSPHCCHTLNTTKTTLHFSCWQYRTEKTRMHTRNKITHLVLSRVENDPMASTNY